MLPLQGLQLKVEWMVVLEGLNLKEILFSDVHLIQLHYLEFHLNIQTRKLDLEPPCTG